MCARESQPNDRRTERPSFVAHSFTLTHPLTHSLSIHQNALKPLTLILLAYMQVYITWIRQCTLSNLPKQVLQNEYCTIHLSVTLNVILRDNFRHHSISSFGIDLILQSSDNYQ